MNQNPMKTETNRMLRHSLLLLALLLPLAGRAMPIPAPPTFDASGYLLMDVNSGHIMAESDADERLEPASLTKIMTAYVIFRELAEGNVKLDESVLISEKAWRTGGSRTFIEVNDKVPLEVLLHGMITQSGNDASVALAEHIAGSEETFAHMMNNQAKRLGMSNSHFTNATGLPDENHYSTARDLAKVSIATIRDFPENYAWYSYKEFTYNNITQKNRNKLLWEDERVDGIKTGYTKAAGYCLISSAVEEDMRLLTVVLGTASTRARTQATRALLNYGFRFYETHRLYSRNQAVATPRIWGGSKELLPVGPEQDVYVTLARGQYDQLEASLTLLGDLQAPVQSGQQVGAISVRLKEETLAEPRLVALEDIPEGNLLRRAKDAVLRWFQ
jgi:D-alanyl-D-alanine carboxypeptidase (penicillin-binding protein 5/6)